MYLYVKSFFVIISLVYSFYCICYSLLKSDPFTQEGSVLVLLQSAFYVTCSIQAEKRANSHLLQSVTLRGVIIMKLWGSPCTFPCMYIYMCMYVFFKRCAPVLKPSKVVGMGAKLGFLPGCQGHSGSNGGPTQCPGSSVAFTRPRAAGFTRARQTDPLHAIKPSTREQRGQVLRAALKAHLHPAGEQTASSQAKRPSIARSPLTRH